MVKVIQIQTVFILSIVILVMVSSIFCSLFFLKAAGEVLSDVNRISEKNKTQVRIDALLNEIKEKKKSKEYQEWHENYVRNIEKDAKS